VYHTIVPTRSAAEIATVLGEQRVPTWVSDCYGAQLKAPAQVFQLCLAHQLRDLQRVRDEHPTEAWATAVQPLLRAAIHLRNWYLSGALTLNGLMRRITETENRLDELLAQKVKSEAGGKLQQRFRQHRDKLLTFLQDPAIPPTNNESEQALRSSVVYRKVTNGFRSEWGARAYAALQSITATAKQKGQQVFQAFADLMGTPVLSYLAT
jgi:transposase